MEPPTTGQEAVGHDESPVHNWRVSQLERLGVPGPLAHIYADRIDWHQMARLVMNLVLREPRSQEIQRDVSAFEIS